MARLSAEHFRAQTPAPKRNRLSGLFKLSARKSVSPVAEAPGKESPKVKASPTIHGKLRKGFEKVGLFPADRLTSASSDMERPDTARSAVAKQELEIEDVLVSRSLFKSMVAAATRDTDVGGINSNKTGVAELPGEDPDGEDTAMFIGDSGHGKIENHQVAAIDRPITPPNPSNWSAPEGWGSSTGKRRKSKLTHIPLAAVEIFSNAHANVKETEEPVGESMHVSDGHSVGDPKDGNLRYVVSKDNGKNVGQPVGDKMTDKVSEHKKVLVEHSVSKKDSDHISERSAHVAEHNNMQTGNPRGEKINKIVSEDHALISKDNSGKVSQPIDEKSNEHASKPENNNSSEQPVGDTVNDHVSELDVHVTENNDVGEEINIDVVQEPPPDVQVNNSTDFRTAGGQETFTVETLRNVLGRCFKNGPNVLTFGPFSITDAASVTYLWQGIVVFHLAVIFIAAVHGPMYMLSYFWKMLVLALMYQLFLLLGGHVGFDAHVAVLDPLLYTFPWLLQCGFVTIGFAVGYHVRIAEDGFVAGYDAED